MTKVFTVLDGQVIKGGTTAQENTAIVQLGLDVDGLSQEFNDLSGEFAALQDTITDSLALKLDKTTFDAQYELVTGKNLHDPSKALNLVNLRHADGTASILASSSTFTGSAPFPLKWGTTYVYSGTAMSSQTSASANQAGLYTTDNLVSGTQALINIDALAGGLTLVTGPTGVNGFRFTTPSGTGDLFGVAMLKRLNGEINGTFQVEEGSLPTVFESYVESNLIKASLLPAGLGGGSSISGLTIEITDAQGTVSDGNGGRVNAIDVNGNPIGANESVYNSFVNGNYINSGIMAVTA